MNCHYYYYYNYWLNQFLFPWELQRDSIFPVFPLSQSFDWRQEEVIFQTLSSALSRTLNHCHSLNSHIIAFTLLYTHLTRHFLSLFYPHTICLSVVHLFLSARVFLSHSPRFINRLRPLSAKTLPFIYHPPRSPSADRTPMMF